MKSEVRRLKDLRLKDNRKAFLQQCRKAFFCSTTTELSLASRGWIYLFLWNIFKIELESLQISYYKVNIFLPKCKNYTIFFTKLPPVFQIVNIFLAHSLQPFTKYFYVLFNRFPNFIPLKTLQKHLLWTTRTKTII